MPEDRGYLVLSRHNFERIYITTPEGERLEIVSLPKKCGQNRIGVVAPRNYKIDRNEQPVEV
mgnify:CR=1 FL=1